MTPWCPHYWRENKLGGSFNVDNIQVSQLFPPCPKRWSEEKTFNLASQIKAMIVHMYSRKAKYVNFLPIVSGEICLQQ